MFLAFLLPIFFEVVWKIYRKRIREVDKEKYRQKKVVEQDKIIWERI
jgi:hypothetical protein